MKGIKTFMFIASVLLIALAIACSVEPETNKNTASVSFSESGRSIVSLQEPFAKEDYYWKYAARKLLVLGQSDVERIDLSAQTPSYDEEGAVFIHEDTPGLDGKVDGFSEGNWDFLLFAYRRSGEEGNYTYSLVYRGETKAVTLVKDAENVVDVKIGPVSDHGNGTLFVDVSNISFAPAGEIDEGSKIAMSYTVKSIPEGTEQTGEDGVYSLEPGLYRVDVKYAVDEYTYAKGAVIATVYSNQTTAVSGTVSELQTYVDIDIPDQG